MAAGYKAGGKPDPVWWLGEVRKGIEHRNKLTYKTKWDRWRKWYRGNYAENVLPDNVFFKMLRTMVPRVYFRNPAVSISPRKRQQGQIDYYVMAMLLEQVDNALFDRMHVKAAMKKAVQDAFMFGTGIVKLGYGAQYSYTPEIGEPTADAGDKKGNRVEYNSYILPDTPWLLRVPTGRFIVPRYSMDWPSCRWVAHEEMRHIDDVRDDPRLENVKDLQPGVLNQVGEDAVGKASDQVSMIEIRDKKTGKVFVLAPTQQDKVLAYEDDQLQFDARLPFFPIQFNADDEYFWAVPDAQILDPHQKEMNEIRRVIRAHRKLSVIKFLFREGDISIDDISKLINGDEIAAGIKIGKDAASFEQAIKQITAGDIPNGLLKASEIENQALQEILGLGVNQFGEYAPGSSDRSATEAMIVNQATQIRTDERRDVVADVIVSMTEHLNHTILTQWEGEQVVSILGPEGQAVWVAFKSSDIKSLEYDVKVDPDSSVPETKAIREAKTVKLYELTMQDANFDKRKMAQRLATGIDGPQGLDLLQQQQQAPPAQPGQIGAPGTPGSSAAQPMSAQQLIQLLAARAGQGEVAKVMKKLRGAPRRAPK